MIKPKMSRVPQTVRKRAASLVLTASKAIWVIGFAAYTALMALLIYTTIIVCYNDAMMRSIVIGTLLALILSFTAIALGEKVYQWAKRQ